MSPAGLINHLVILDARLPTPGWPGALKTGALRTNLPACEIRRRALDFGVSRQDVRLRPSGELLARILQRHTRQYSEEPLFFPL